MENWLGYIYNVLGLVQPRKFSSWGTKIKLGRVERIVHQKGKKEKRKKLKKAISCQLCNLAYFSFFFFFFSLHLIGCSLQLAHTYIFIYVCLFIYI